MPQLYQFGLAHYYLLLTQVLQTRKATRVFLFTFLRFSLYSLLQGSISSFCVSYFVYQAILTLFNTMAGFLFQYPYWSCCLCQFCVILNFDWLKGTEIVEKLYNWQNYSWRKTKILLEAFPSFSSASTVEEQELENFL